MAPPKKIRPARAKAARPDVSPLDEHLAAMLNPALSKSTEGTTGFEEAPAARYVGELVGREPVDRLGGVAATVESLKALLEAGDPNIVQTRAWTPHRPPRPDKSEGGVRFEIVSEFEPKGDQPRAIDELVAGVAEHERDQVAFGRHGVWKNLHDGPSNSTDTTSCLGTGAE